MTIEHNNRQAGALQQPAQTMTNQIPLFQLFVFLQVLDLLTTIVVLKLGGFEANPLVDYLMRIGPIQGLILAKAIVIAGGAATFWYNRQRVVLLASYVYAGIVCWNLLGIVAVY